jgi:hypothetical protein
MYLNLIPISKPLSKIIKANIQLEEFLCGLVLKSKISNHIPQIAKVMSSIMKVITVNQTVKAYHFV